MDHCTKDGAPKILKECSLPLTGKRCVNLVVSDLAVIEVGEKGMILREVAPGLTADDVQKVTEPKLIISPELKTIEV
jgi:3-oxoacid CoA-transferase subunit B